MRFNRLLHIIESQDDILAGLNEYDRAQETVFMWKSYKRGAGPRLKGQVYVLDGTDLEAVKAAL